MHLIGLLTLQHLTGNKKTGGGERDRTDDLLRARQALSQLSYTPSSGDRRQDSGDRRQETDKPVLISGITVSRLTQISR